MKIHERAEFVRAMEKIARAVNDENVFDLWLAVGVADGDINGRETDEDLECYVADDDTFADLMHVFLCLMAKAKKSGGLYFDGVESKSLD